METGLCRFGYHSVEDAHHLFESSLPPSVLSHISRVIRTHSAHTSVMTIATIWDFCPPYPYPWGVTHDRIPTSTCASYPLQSHICHPAYWAYLGPYKPPPRTGCSSCREEHAARQTDNWCTDPAARPTSGSHTTSAAVELSTSAVPARLPPLQDTQPVHIPKYIVNAEDENLKNSTRCDTPGGSNLALGWVHMIPGSASSCPGPSRPRCARLLYLLRR